MRAQPFAGVVLGIALVVEQHQIIQQAEILMFAGLGQQPQAGLAAGADDYIAKPFRVGELVARIRARLRLATVTASDAPVPSTGLHIDAAARRVWVDGVEVRTRHGRIGTGGQADVEGLSTPQEAEEHTQKLILQKTIEGYAEVDRSGADDEDADDVPTERVKGD